MPDTLITNSPIIAAYRAATPGSAAASEKASRLFPSGVTHDSRYIEPYGLYITRAQWPRKWDVDGNCYVDYFGGHGALLIGHCHPKMVEAGKQQIKVDGKMYLLEVALRADFALVHAFLVDYLGNLSYALTARNFNPVIAMAADTVIVDADNIVPIGVISPDHIVTPAPVVDYLVMNA